MTKRKRSDLKKNETSFLREERTFRRTIKELLSEFYYWEYYRCDKQDQYRLGLGLPNMQIPFWLLVRASQVLYDEEKFKITEENVAQVFRVHAPTDLQDRILNLPILPDYKGRPWIDYLKEPYNYRLWAEVTTALIPFWDLVNMVDDIYACLASYADSCLRVLSLQGEEKKIEPTSMVWEKFKAVQKCLENKETIKLHPLAKAHPLAKIGRRRCLKKYSPEYFHAPTGWLMRKYMLEKLLR